MEAVTAQAAPTLTATEKTAQPLKALISKYLTIKMKHLFFFYLLFSSLTVAGQGKITGVIINKSNKIPIEFAHVEVCSAEDNQLIVGAVTDVNGNFHFDNLHFGEYNLKYSFIGFEKTDSIRFTVSKDKSVVNIGKLELEELTHNLDEVVVSARKSSYVYKIDRKVFNVGEDLMSASGSAIA